MAVHLTVSDRGHELSGVVRPGESWRDAALRTTASLHVEPVPLDLSGEPKRFVVDHDRRVALRAMVRGDLPDVLRWRLADHVRRWWHDQEPPTRESVQAHYGPRIDGVVPTRMWVVEVNGRSAGFVQDYRLADGSVGVDYVVGEPHLVGQGIGTSMLWVWLHGARRRYRDATTCFAAPDHRNEASLRLLDKVGFERGTWYDEPQGDGTTSTLVGCSLDLARVVG
jgi:aminoglycoside 6'-N-acetyltransferase